MTDRAALADERETVARIIESKMLQVPKTGTLAFQQRRTKELSVEAADAILALRASPPPADALDRVAVATIIRKKCDEIICVNQDDGQIDGIPAMVFAAADAIILAARADALDPATIERCIEAAMVIAKGFGEFSTQRAAINLAISSIRALSPGEAVTT